MVGNDRNQKITILTIMIKLFNVGFTQKTAQQFFQILKANKIDCLVDIRLNPNGQLSRFAFGQDLPYFLDKLVDGCQYFHRVDLAPSKDLLKAVRDKDNPMSKDYRLFEKAFYSQIERHSHIGNFVRQFDKFSNVVLLCSEPTTEKCHRRLVSQILLQKFPDDIEFGGNL